MMQIAGLTTIWAPMTYGLATGVTDARAAKRKTIRVQPASNPRNPEAQLDAARTPPTQFWRAANGEPNPNTHIAPPSIMQIRISMILEEQAKERDVPETPENRPQLMLAYDQDSHEIDGEFSDVTDQTTPEDGASYSDENRDRRSVFSTLP